MTQLSWDTDAFPNPNFFLEKALHPCKVQAKLTVLCRISLQIPPLNDSDKLTAQNRESP